MSVPDIAYGSTCKEAIVSAAVLSSGSSIRYLSTAHRITPYASSHTLAQYQTAHSIIRYYARTGHRMQCPVLAYAMAGTGLCNVPYWPTQVLRAVQYWPIRVSSTRTLAYRDRAVRVDFAAPAPFKGQRSMVKRQRSKVKVWFKAWTRVRGREVQRDRER
eukprot:1518874-Rhodomonas_salina.1